MYIPSNGGQLTLVIGCPIKHPKDLEDIAITVIALELVACTVKAQDQLLGTVSIHGTHDTWGLRACFGWVRVDMTWRLAGGVTAQTRSGSNTRTVLNSRGEMDVIHWRSS